MAALVRQIWLLTAIAFGVAPAFADELRTQSEYERCMHSVSGNDSDMNDCTLAEIMSQDKKLNVNFTRLMKSANTAYKNSLRVAQRAWITYRDTTCDLEGAHYLQESQSLSDRLDRSTCMLHLTKERADWLARAKAPATTD